MRFFFFCDFSWQDGCTLPQNSYKSIQDLRESTRLRITMSVDRLARSLEHTDAQLDILLLCDFFCDFKARTNKILIYVEVDEQH